MHFLHGVLLRNDLVEQVSECPFKLTTRSLSFQWWEEGKKPGAIPRYFVLRKKSRSIHPRSDSAPDALYEYQRAVDRLFRVSTGGTSWRNPRKSAHVLASPRFSSPSQHETPFEHIGNENIMLKGDGVEAPCRCVCNAGDFRGYVRDHTCPKRSGLAHSTHFCIPPM